MCSIVVHTQWRFIQFFCTVHLSVTPFHILGPVLLTMIPVRRQCSSLSDVCTVTEALQSHLVFHRQT